MRGHVPALQADYAFVVQPSNTNGIALDSNNKLQAPACALFYGGAAAANISVIMASDPDSTPTAIVLTNVQPGQFLPVIVRRVNSTNTTAAAGTIIGLVGKQGAQ